MEYFGYLDQLISDCHAAKRAIPIKELTLYKDNDFNEIKSIKSAIYIIEEIDGDNQKTFDKFNAFRKQQEEKEDRDKLKCAQPNSPSTILYVGSSSTGLKKRLEEHTIKCSKKTHALRLNEWFEGNYKIDVKVYDVPRAILQLIEDNLAHNLNPAFGKKGSNNK
jgi:hypothetical protein